MEIRFSLSFIDFTTLFLTHYNTQSIVLDMPEGLRVADRLAEPMPVLDVAAEVANPRVEDIVEGVLAKEEVADDPHAPCVFVIHPEPTEVCYRVYCFLYLAHLTVKILERHTGMQANLSHHFPILLNEGDDRLAVIFRDVLRLIFQFLFVDLLPLFQLFLLWTCLILRDAFKLSDRPRFFVEVIAVGELRHYGRMINLHDGSSLLFFFLVDPIHNAVIMKMVLLGEDIVEFHLTQAFAVILVVVVLDHGEVEHRRTVTRLDED